MVEDKISQKKKQVRIVIGVLLSLIVVMVIASFYSKPGDGTYPIHSFIESSKLYLISSDIEKAKYRLTLADRRLIDMQELLTKNSRSASIAQDEFSNQIIAVQELAEKMSKKDQKMIDDEVFKRLKTFTQLLGFDDDLEDAKAKSSSDVMDSGHAEE